MARKKTSHAHVGALSDAKKAITREQGRARVAKHRAKVKGQGLKLAESAAAGLWTGQASNSPSILTCLLTGGSTRQFP
jgi:hypothetical protein